MIINVTYKMTFAKKIDEKAAYGKQAEKRGLFFDKCYGSKILKRHKTIVIIGSVECDWAFFSNICLEKPLILDKIVKKYAKK